MHYSYRVPPKGGHKPLHAHETHFVDHKVHVAALDRLIDHFGAYLSHLTNLIDDPRTKPGDWQKLKGYLLKWQDGNMLFGSAYLCDLLKPSSILCKILQEDDVCMVRAIEAVVRTSTLCISGEKLKATTFPACSND